VKSALVSHDHPAYPKGTFLQLGKSWQVKGQTFTGQSADVAKWLWAGGDALRDLIANARAIVEDDRYRNPSMERALDQHMARTRPPDEYDTWRAYHAAAKSQWGNLQASAQALLDFAEEHDLEGLADAMDEFMATSDPTRLQEMAEELKDLLPPYLAAELEGLVEQLEEDHRLYGHIQFLISMALNDGYVPCSRDAKDWCESGQGTTHLCGLLACPPDEPCECTLLYRSEEYVPPSDDDGGDDGSGGGGGGGAAGADAAAGKQQAAPAEQAPAKPEDQEEEDQPKKPPDAEAGKEDSKPKKLKKAGGGSVTSDQTLRVPKPRSRPSVARPSRLRRRRRTAGAEAAWGEGRPRRGRSRRPPPRRPGDSSQRTTPSDDTETETRVPQSSTAEAGAKDEGDGKAYASCQAALNALSAGSLKSDEEQLDCLWSGASRTFDSRGRSLIHGLKKPKAETAAARRMVQALKRVCGAVTGATGGRVVAKGAPEDRPQAPPPKDPKEGKGTKTETPEGSPTGEPGTKPGDTKGGKPEDKERKTEAPRPGDKPNGKKEQKTVAECGTLRKKDFQEIAMEWVPAYGAVMKHGLSGYSIRNYLEINRQFTEAYKIMYALNPSAFKWIGAASVVSSSVGKNIRKVQYGVRGNPNVPPIVPMRPYVIPTSTQIKKFLIIGNATIFRDIFWQHIAFLYCGAAQMEALNKAGELADALLEAWLMIARGLREGNVELIWKGNELIAKHEQKTVLQPVIDKHSEAASLGAWGADTSIPGADTPFDSNKNFADEDHRWDWVANEFWPAYREHEAAAGPKLAETPVPPWIKRSVDSFPSTR